MDSKNGLQHNKHPQIADSPYITYNQEDQTYDIINQQNKLTFRKQSDPPNTTQVVNTAIVRIENNTTHMPVERCIDPASALKHPRQTTSLDRSDDDFEDEKYEEGEFSRANESQQPDLRNLVLNKQNIELATQQLKENQFSGRRYD